MLSTNIRKFLSLTFIIFLFLNAWSQDCHIMLSGKVVDQHDEENLEFATVYIQELNSGTVCDSLGQFTLGEICPGKYHIIVSHLGCESKNYYISIMENTHQIFHLEHHEELMDEVEITGDASQSKTGLNKNTIKKEILFEQAGKSLSEILTSIPGVSTLKSGPNLSKPMIQGMYGNRVTILNHGIPQEGQQWGNDHAPEIDPNTADKISVYKGASAIRFGLQAIGGIVILEPEEIPKDPHWHGSYQTTLQTNGLNFSGAATVGKSYDLAKIRLTGGFAKSGDKKTPDYFLTNTGNSDISFSIIVSNHTSNKWKRLFYYSYFYNKNGILRGSHIGNVTDLEEAFSRKVPFYTEDKFSYNIDVPRQEVNHHLAKYNTKYFINESSNFNLDIGIQVNQRSEFDIRRSNRNDKPALDLNLFSQYYDLYYFKQSDNLEYTAGIQYRNANNTNVPGTGILPLIPDYINNTGAGYLISKYKMKNIQIESGLRVEFRNYFVAKINNNKEIIKYRLNYLNWAANLGLKSSISKDIKTVVDISFTNRPPEVNELFSNGLHQGVSGIEEGNIQLKAENSFKIVNEWDGKISPSTNITASLFYNRISNYIYLQPQKEFRLTIRGAFPVFKYIGTDALLAGGDIKLIHNLTHHLQASSGLSYIYAKNITQNSGLIRIPPLNLQLNLSYTFGKFWKIHEIKTVLGFSYDAKQTNVDLNEDFLNPPDEYYLVNISTKFRLKTGKGNDIDIQFRAENLLNNTYRQYLNRLRYFADETGSNFSLNIKSYF